MIKPLSLAWLLFISLGLNAQTDFDQLVNDGSWWLQEGDMPQARRDLEKAATLIPANYPLEKKAIFYNNLGVLYYESGDYKKGIDTYSKSLGYYRQIGRDSLTAESLLNLGLAYKGICLYEKATQELTLAARIFERIGREKDLASAWNGIGNIQREMGNFKKALSYHHKALYIREQIDYRKGIADSYHNIGSVYLDAKQLDSAAFFLHKALRIKQELGNEWNTLTTKTLLGQLYLDKNQLDKAFEYLNHAYNIRTESGNATKIASSLFYLGTYYAKTGQRAKALESFRQVEIVSRESGNHQLLSDALSSEIALLGNTSSKLLTSKYKELLDTRELLATEENRKGMARLEIEYDVERKDQEIKMQRKQARIDAVNIENQQLRNQQLLIGLAGLVLVALVLMYGWFQVRKKKNRIQSQNVVLEDQKQEIQHLHNELSHRTKNYFSMLSGILKFDRSKATNPEVEKVLEENIRRLEAMSLVQRYLLEDSTQRNKDVRLDMYLGNLIDSLILNLGVWGNKIEAQKELEKVYVDYDIAMRIAIVLNELICNAIEHGFKNVGRPVLNVWLKKEKDGLYVVVKDNGEGFLDIHLSKSSRGIELMGKVLHKIDGKVTYKNENGCIATLFVKA